MQIQYLIIRENITVFLFFSIINSRIVLCHADMIAVIIMVTRVGHIVRGKHQLKLSIELLKTLKMAPSSSDLSLQAAVPSI